MERYLRQIILPEIGISGQHKLKQSKVLVIGAGGLGCAVLPYLVSSGTGKIGIVEGDTVSLSNLHRQILYTQEEIGQKKAIIAQKKLSFLNPEIEIELYPEPFTTENALSILSKYDYIADCTDNFTARYLINDVCVQLNKPFISASIYQYEGQLSVFNYQGSGTYRCLFPEPPENIPSCADAGVIPTLPAIMGGLQANEILKCILGIGEVLSNKLLIFNALTMNYQLFSFSRNPELIIPDTIQSQAISCVSAEYKLKEIEYATLQEWQNNHIPLQLVDVRSTEERKRFNIGGLHIPLPVFYEEALSKLSKEFPVVLYCHSGIRSADAGEFLLENGYTEVYHLKKGILEISL